MIDLLLIALVIAVSGFTGYQFKMIFEEEAARKAIPPVSEEEWLAIWEARRNAALGAQVQND